MTGIAPTLECPCGGSHRREAFAYEAPPAVETRFPWPKGTYRRAYDCCGLCGHYFSRHEMDLSGLYGGTYVDATYVDAEGMRRTFDRIVSLPRDRSDNIARVEAVDDFGRSWLGVLDRAPTIMDVGSGLCVFLHGMKAKGWNGTALDPDPRAAEHARTAVGITAIQADFFSLDITRIGGFDALSLNKVIEHVENPVAMLVQARALIRAGGFLYVEVPNGPAAARDPDGSGREEFTIEHHHVFSAASTALAMQRAGFQVIRLDEIREPSTKYTIRCYASPL